jgi:hypothetical protein
MVTRVIAGVQWRALSPSLYEHIAHPITVRFDGMNWRIDDIDQDFENMANVSDFVSEAIEISMDIAQ